jgi:DNA-binding NarL/FixJ family response regulator
MRQHAILADEPVEASRMSRTVLVCDDRKELRDAITELLALMPDFEVVASAVDADTCLAGVHRHRPDMLIVDLNMPGGGPNVVRNARTINPTMHIVVFTGQDGEAVRREMLGAGADQYVVKTGRLTPLIAALRRFGGEQPHLPTQRRPGP